jgi:hypothetical protein
MDELTRIAHKLRDIKTGKIKDQTIYSHLTPPVNEDTNFKIEILNQPKNEQPLSAHYDADIKVSDDSPPLNSFLASVINPHGNI